MEVTTTNELIQPEMLSTHRIIEILRQRGVNVKDDEDRSKLLAIYDKLVLPKPQRLFNEDRRTYRDLIRRREKLAAATNSEAQHGSTLVTVTDPIPINCKRQYSKTEERKDIDEAPRAKKAMISWP